MAVLRDHPYGNFNFVVTIDGSSETAGFSEVRAPSVTVDVVEYRTGADKTNQVRKLPGVVRYGDVTLKRGIVGSRLLYEWVEAVRTGAADVRRTVTIQLLNEDRSDVVWTWKLLRAFPRKYEGPTLRANGNDVAIEELVLCHEGLEVD
jgi:phage tail-like protein